MKLPRDLDGVGLARILERFGYTVTRQTGSHLRLTSTFKGSEHHVTIPRHATLKVGTLGAILRDVAQYLEIDRSALVEELFSA